MLHISVKMEKILSKPNLLSVKLRNNAWYCKQSGHVSVYQFQIMISQNLFRKLKTRCISLEVKTKTKRFQIKRTSRHDTKLIAH